MLTMDVVKFSFMEKKLVFGISRIKLKLCSVSCRDFRLSSVRRL